MLESRVCFQAEGGGLAAGGGWDDWVKRIIAARAISEVCEVLAWFERGGECGGLRSPMMLFAGASVRPFAPGCTKPVVAFMRAMTC